MSQFDNYHRSNYNRTRRRRSRSRSRTSSNSSRRHHEPKGFRIFRNVYKDHRSQTKDLISNLFQVYQQEQNNPEKLLLECVIPYVICWDNDNKHSWSTPDKNGFRVCDKCTAVTLDYSD